MTWLYGPLLSRHSDSTRSTFLDEHESSASLSNVSNKKQRPRKQSISDIMIQYLESLVSNDQQYNAIFSSQPSIMSRNGGNAFENIPTPLFLDSPGQNHEAKVKTGGRHVHFDGEVRQYVVVDIKDSYEDGWESHLYAQNDLFLSDLEDGKIKLSEPTKEKALHEYEKTGYKYTFGRRGTAIAVLPSTMLKA